MKRWLVVLALVGACKGKDKEAPAAGSTPATGSAPATAPPAGSPCCRWIVSRTDSTRP
jgi:hypothetical protein